MRYNERINIRKIRIFRLPSKRKNGCSGYYPPDKAEERRVRRTQVFTMKTLGYYNGKFGPLDEMTVPMNDRVSYFGDGVYDAAMVRNRKIFALDDHLDRFYNSLRLLRIEPPMERSELAATLNDLVSRLDSDAPHMLYWQSTRAAAHRKHAFPAGAKATLMAFAEACPLDRHDHPYKLITVEDTRFLHCNVKTLNLLPSVLAAKEAEEAGCQECIFHRGDIVTECAHSNVSILKDGVLKTHPTDHLILPGIARIHLIAMCKELGIPVDECNYTMKELMDADEVIVHSSGTFAVGVESVDGIPVGGKAPELLKKLQDALTAEFLAATQPD